MIHPYYWTAIGLVVTSSQGWIWVAGFVLIAGPMLGAWITRCADCRQLSPLPHPRLCPNCRSGVWVKKELEDETPPGPPISGAHMPPRMYG